MSEWPVQFDTPILIAQAHGGETATHTTEAPAAEAHAAEGHGSEGHGSEGHGSPWQFFFFSLGAFVVLAIIAILGTRRLRLVPKGLQNFLELIVDALYGLPEMVMGPRGRKYAPFVATLFLYIFVMNITGFIPGMKPGTANLSITLGLAIFAFIAVQYFGFKAHGIGYLKHFAGPVLWLAPLILPLELISELVRPVSLSIRLYGNIFGEEQVVGALATQFNPFVAVLMLPLQIMTSVLQALVFTLLVTVYISLATEPHEHRAEGSEEAPAH